MTLHRRPRKRRGKSRDLLKDRLIQTRVPGGLESTLKEEARKRRLSVSHLIRNVLEDTFHLVDNVVSEVDHLVQDSVNLALQVGRDAGRIAETARKSVDPGRSASRSRKAERTPVPAEPDPLAHVLAWNKVVMNQPGRCAKCGRALEKGAEAHLGLTATPAPTPTWLCAVCIGLVG